VKKSMPQDHPSLVPQGHPAEANEHWTTSSTPSVTPLVLLLLKLEHNIMSISISYV
jgi:hypothetical protein